MNKIILLVIPMVFFAAGCTQNINQESNIVNINGHEITVEIADTETARNEGLSNRDSLGENDGMLFVFPAPAQYSFWMKDMRFALDFIWIANGKIVDMTENIPPEANVPDMSLKIYKSSMPVDSVLEVNAGWIAKNGIKVGDKVVDLTF